jgi:alpha-1,6-mannosyltransferase
MTVCDFSPLYCAKGGGIRTYHQARIDWFSRQTRHRYVLISPGPRFRATRLSPPVWWIQVYGTPFWGDPERYRLLLDYPAVRAVIERLHPDVLEMHDPWFSVPFGLRLRRLNIFRGLLTAFWHSDPVTTYIEPHLTKLIGRGRMTNDLREWSDSIFHRARRHFDATFVSSETMRAKLSGEGLENVIVAGFGVNPAFLAIRRTPGSRFRPRNLLYAGRLDNDKEFQVVLDVLPELLRRPDVFVTVMGIGALEKRLAALSHPRLNYLGFVSDPQVIRTVYATNDILLAPGRFETFGLAALEAAAAGLVVIGPREGGTGEILRQMQSPFSFPAGDRRQFLDSVISAIEGETADVAERGRVVAAGYGTWSDAVARQIVTYDWFLNDSAWREAARRSA